MSAHRLSPSPAASNSGFRWARAWPEWLLPQGLALAGNEEERKAQAMERRFRYHGFQVPILRIMAILFLALMVALHPGEPGVPMAFRLLRFLGPAFAYWALAFALIRIFYRKTAFQGLGELVLSLDVLLVLLAIHESGSGRSMMLPVMLLPISFTSLSSFRLSLASSLAFPFLYLGYMALSGHSFVWPAEILKALILLLSGLYLALTSLVLQGWRRRLNEALDVSRDLIRQLEDRGSELEESKLRADQASIAKSVFLSNMSHELRTPLNAILGYSQLLRRRSGLEADVEEQLGRIQRSGEHLLGLINNVLTISKIEAVGIQALPEPFRPAELFQSLDDILRIRAQDKGIAFLVEIEAPFPEAVLGDESKLRQVLLNLLGNAIKFTDRGQVRLQAAYRRGMAAFAVEDTGPGLAPAEIEALFHRFTQTDAGRASSEGTGLGLHISQAIARALGGGIRVASEVGRGTTFSFEIPLPPTDPSPSAPSLPAAGGGEVLLAGQAAARILVVDDREENRDLLVRILEDAGLRPVPAPGGVEALQAIRGQRPDLVFLDIRMPGMDGFEVLRRIREEETALALPALPVVALTASVLDHERESVLAQGFDDYIRKPFTLREITECIHRLLGLRFAASSPEPAAPSSDPEASARALDAGVRKELLAAIVIGDLDEALRILDGAEDPAAAGPLRDLAKKYRFEKLKDLLAEEPPC